MASIGGTTFTYDGEGQRVSKTTGSTTTSYTYEGDQLVMQTTGNTSLFFLYDSNGLIGFDHIVSGTTTAKYYYQIDGKGEIIGITDTAGNIVAKYTYDAWGNPTKITDANGNAITYSTHIGIINPFRYKSYYYDTDTGLYYLNSRYYDPLVCRFISSDTQLSLGNDLTGTNLFVYCGNNPVNRVDPTGEAWWHWAVGAAIVAATAVATVVTCGSFAAAVTAVGLVGNGMAAATTAATVATAAFIGSATAYGVAVLSAAANSNSVEEFNEQGNLGTVAATAGGALLYGVGTYLSTDNSSRVVTNSHASRGSTGRTEPNNLLEDLAMEQVRTNPHAGTQIKTIQLNDARWPSTEGWVKMQQVVPTSRGNINIHYVFNQNMNIFDDFKFKQ